MVLTVRQVAAHLAHGRQPRLGGAHPQLAAGPQQGGQGAGFTLRAGMLPEVAASSQTISVSVYKIGQHEPMQSSGLPA